MPEGGVTSEKYITEPFQSKRCTYTNVRTAVRQRSASLLLAGVVAYLDAQAH